MKTAGGGAIPRLARVMTCLMLMLTGLTTGAWAADTYTVAGSNSNMFGSAWDATYTANDMTKNSDGTYSITYTNVYLDGDVQYKVVKNHSWDEAYPAGNNRVITIAEAGTYTVTICFNPTTHEVYEKKPGYTVSLAEGTEDAENWTITPVEGLNEGEAVTIQYNGTRRIKSVTAVTDWTTGETLSGGQAEEKLTPALSITSPSVGQVIGSDGKNYAYGIVPSGVTAVAKICYVSGSHGLALALADEQGTMNWSTAQTTCAAHTPAITGGTWKLASQAEWDNMINAAGSYTALRDGFNSVGGTNMQEEYYWSSTENGSDYARGHDFWDGSWDNVNKEAVVYARACLAF